MAKMVGIIGYMLSEEKEPGYFVPTPRELPCRGDLTKNYVQRNSSEDSTNDTITLANNVSIVADPYTKNHVFEMTYLKFKYPKIGGVWKITKAEIQEPRIILTLGGVYNGIQAESSE